LAGRWYTSGLEWHLAAIGTIAAGFLGNHTSVLDSQVGLILIVTGHELAVYANTITTLQTVCKDLSSLAVYLHRIELAGALFTFSDVKIFTVNNGEISDLVAIVELFKSDCGSAFFADDLADD
jgi:hypothetical protein